MSDDGKTLMRRFENIIIMKKNAVIWAIICVILILVIVWVLTSMIAEINQDEKTQRAILDSTDNNILLDGEIADIVDISYPQFESLSTKVNEIIKEEALSLVNKYIDAAKEGTLMAEIDYEVKYKTDKFLSVVFSGMVYVKNAAHPNFHCYSVNIDIENECRMRLSDFIELDDTFIEKIKAENFTFEMWEDEETNETYYVNDYFPFDLERLSCADDNSAREINRYRMYGNSVYSYLTKNKIGIVFPVPHPIGDYKVIELDKDEYMSEAFISKNDSSKWYLDSIKAELEDKGWKNVRIERGLFDYFKYSELIAERSDKDKKAVKYTVLGDTDNKYITVGIEVMFDKDNPNGGIYNVIYLSGSGRLIESKTDWYSFFDKMEIVSADNEDLIDFMYSY